jgi:hypothetical protein
LFACRRELGRNVARHADVFIDGEGRESKKEQDMRKALITGVALAALSLTTVTSAQAASVYFGVGSGPYYGGYYDDDYYYRYHHPYYGYYGARYRYDYDDWYWRHHYYRHHYWDRDYDGDRDDYWRYHRY